MKGNALVSAVAVLAIAFMLALAGCAGLPPLPKMPGDNGTAVQPGGNLAGSSGNLLSFQSWDEISSFLKSASQQGSYGGYGRGEMMLNTLGGAKATTQAMAPASPTASDYSQTNVQVQGVDEADIVKNDGKYIYAAGAQNYYGSYGRQAGKVAIIDAYPAESMKKAAEIEIEGSVRELLLYKDRLVVFGSRYEERFYPMQLAMARCSRCVMPPYYSQNFAFMAVYDVSDHAKPKLVKEIEVKGDYKESRMIGSKVYAIFTDWAGSDYPVPLYSVDGVQKEIAPQEVKFFDWPGENYNYNVFVSLDLEDLSRGETREVLLMGDAQTVYVSQENIYVAYTGYGRYVPSWKAYEEVYGDVLPLETRWKIKEIDAMNVSGWRKDRLKSAEAAAFVYNDNSYLSIAARLFLQETWQNRTQELQRQAWEQGEKTVVSRIALDGFAYLGSGEVPGHLLNQFSMDESGGYLRLATTQSAQWGWRGESAPSSNNLYVLGPKLDVVGKIEGIAKGEKIYSVRFMGNRAYMVTFKKVDPFFVLDLSKPAEPKILGKLKIPGYSDYLHPYGENYVIGLGKGAAPSESGDFAWYQGVKLSLFDVHDLANPKEVAKFEIGDRGSDSYALSDHKAFLFSEKRGLLVIPVLEAKIDKGKYAGKVDSWAYGDYVFQGAYVFNVTPEKGFELRGRITHATAEEMMKAGEYFWSNANVKRSLYMDDCLYTVSDGMVKANRLSTLGEISSVQLPGQDYAPPRYYQ